MKFATKLTLCMLGLVCLLFGVGGSLLITLSFHTALEREQESVYSAYQMMLGTLNVVGEIHGRLEESDISHTLEQLVGQQTGGWTALRLYTSDKTLYEYQGEHLAPPRQPPATGQCILRTVSDGAGGHSLTVSGGLEVGEQVLYLDAARDVSSLFETRQAEQRTYQWVFWGMAGLCALLSYSLSKLLTRPLVGLSKASRAIAAGTLSSRAPVSSGDEVGLVARDFNEMAESLEGNIHRLEEAAQRQERFMASFAHEVKTPMTSIIGYADLLRGQMLTQEEELQAANYIVSEGKRLESLSRKLLELLVLQRGQAAFLSVRPAALVQGLVAHLEPLYAQRGIALTCQCQEGECLLEPDLVKSLLINLWDNARKAMGPEGGSIETTVEMLSGGCRIRVEDSGRGIPPEAMEHLTEAFYRVDKSRARNQGGVGLGLSLCREIAGVHGGDIRFENRAGGGAAVTVELKGGGGE